MLTALRHTQIVRSMQGESVSSDGCHALRYLIKEVNWMPLFEVVVLETPTTKEMEDGKLEVLKLGPKVIIARDSQSAAVSVVRDGGVKEVDPSRMKVLVRPFS